MKTRPIVLGLGLAAWGAACAAVASYWFATCKYGNAIGRDALHASTLEIRDSKGRVRWMIDSETGMKMLDAQGVVVFQAREWPSNGAGSVGMWIGHGIDEGSVDGVKLNPTPELAIVVLDGVPSVRMSQQRESLEISVGSGVAKAKR